MDETKVIEDEFVGGVEYVDGYRRIRLYPVQMTELTMLAFCGGLAGLCVSFALLCVAAVAFLPEPGFWLVAIICAGQAASALWYIVSTIRRIKRDTSFDE